MSNYSKTCKNYTNENPYLEVYDTNKENITTTYKEPLSINENCPK